MGPMEEFPFPSPGWRHLSLGSNHGVEPVARALTTFHGVIPKTIATAHTSGDGHGPSAHAGGTLHMGRQ